MDRRSFLKSAAATAAAAVPFNAFIARVEAKKKPQGVGYGPIGPVADQTTGLPLAPPSRGIYATSASAGPVTSWPTAYPHRGRTTAWRHSRAGHRIRLVRNHERGAGTPFSGVALRPGRRGGTTTVDLRHQGRLDCSQTARQPQRHDPQLRRRTHAVGQLDDLRRDHRLHDACRTATSSTCRPTDWAIPQPIRDMGRFSHEALAVDP